jgi:hypothetical protein
MKRFVVALFFVFLFFSAKMVLAYEYTPELSLSLSEEYNDNIFLVHTDRVDDFITYITPGIGLSIRSVNSELRLAYSPTFSYYKSNGDLNETAHSFMANGNFSLSNKLSLTLMDNFVKSSEISDIRAISNVGPITARRELTYNTVSGNISYKLRENLTYRLGASYFFANFKEPGVTEVKAYSGNMGLDYRSSERTTLSANAIYTKYDFRPDSDATEQDYLLGITYRLTQTFTIGVDGGVVVTKIEDTGESDTGFIGGVNLTKKFEKGEAALSYRQSVIAGAQTGVPTRDQTVSLSLTKTLTNKWTGSLSASYSNYKSIETNDVDTDETLFTAGLTYNFTPLANLRPKLTLSYSYADSDDKITNTRDYYNNIVFLTLSLGYGKTSKR